VRTASVKINLDTQVSPVIMYYPPTQRLVIDVEREEDMIDVLREIELGVQEIMRKLAGYGKTPS
jgi:hypothetical protein